MVFSESLLPCYQWQRLQVDLCFCIMGGMDWGAVLGGNLRQSQTQLVTADNCSFSCCSLSIVLQSLIGDCWILRTLKSWYRHTKHVCYKYSGFIPNTIFPQLKCLHGKICDLMTAVITFEEVGGGRGEGQWEDTGTSGIAGVPGLCSAGT